MGQQERDAPMSKKNMEVETLYAIRDARGLKASEKALLFVFATRGKAFATAQTNADDAGMSRTTYYDTRNALIEKGLIVETQRSGTSTIYVVIKEGVRNLAEGCPESGTGGVRNPTEGCPESTTQRRHIREPSKENVKESNETPSFADAHEAAISDSHEPEDDSTDSTSSLEVDISEPSLPTGTVNDSTSNESSTSEESIDLLSEVAATGTVEHGDSSTSEVLEVPAGSRSVPEHIGVGATARRKTSTFSKGELRMAFGLLGASQRGAFGYPPNFEHFEKRIRAGGFEHLDTAQAQLLAAYEVMLAERVNA